MKTTYLAKEKRRSTESLAKSHSNRRAAHGSSQGGGSGSHGGAVLSDLKGKSSAVGGRGLSIESVVLTEQCNVSIAGQALQPAREVPRNQQVPSPAQERKQQVVMKAPLP